MLEALVHTGQLGSPHLRITSLFVLIATLAGFLLGGCASTPTPSGHLVIVGGGLKEDNAAIHTRFVELCTDGPIGIVPTASGDGLEAGAEVAARWRRWAGTREVVVIPLTQHDADKASDPAIIKQIDACGGLWFTGGDQSRIVAVFRPEGKDTPAMQAVRRVLDKGGVVGGTSAGAAMMSDPMITGGRSRSGKSSDPENADDRRVRTGPGLGLFTFGLTDQHFLERGRMGRLIDAIQDTGGQMGFGVSENCAMVVDRGSGESEAIGDRALCVLSARSRDASDGRVASLRLSILSTGDRTDAATGKVTPRTGAHDERVQVCIDTELQPAENLWSLRTLDPILKALCITQPVRRQVYDATTTLTLESDGLTRVLMVPGDATWPCMTDVLLRVKPNATPSLP